MKEREKRNPPWPPRPLRLNEIRACARLGRRRPRPRPIPAPESPPRRVALNRSGPVQRRAVGVDEVPAHSRLGRRCPRPRPIPAPEPPPRRVTLDRPGSVQRRAVGVEFGVHADTILAHRPDPVHVGFPPARVDVLEIHVRLLDQV